MPNYYVIILLNSNFSEQRWTDINTISSIVVSESVAEADSQVFFNVGHVLGWAGPQIFVSVWRHLTF